MNSVVIRLIVFACVFGGALFGMFLRGVLPEHHLSADSKDTVRMGRVDRDVDCPGAGSGTVAFAFCRLLGFQLLPRLKAIHSQKGTPQEKEKFLR